MAWRLINYQRLNAFENMAIDEAIFHETIKNNKPPTIRFYGWQPSAVSLGYFQDIKKEINIEQCHASGVDIVRRLTGGKAVFHCSEVTYCVIACNNEKSFPADILGTYKVISNCISRGLAYLGIETMLAQSGRSLLETDFQSCCFSFPSRNELLVSGRKICGSAQMRSGGGFLQHGSLLMTFDAARTAELLLPPRNAEQLKILGKTVTAINAEIALPISEIDVCSNLRKGFAEIMGVEIEAGEMTQTEEILKNELMKKYMNPQWNNEGKKRNF
jgi:lipoyl(octanoyl) transferase